MSNPKRAKKQQSFFSQKKEEKCKFSGFFFCLTRHNNRPRPNVVTFGPLIWPSCELEELVVLPIFPLLLLSRADTRVDVVRGDEDGNDGGDAYFIGKLFFYLDFFAADDNRLVCLNNATASKH